MAALKNNRWTPLLKAAVLILLIVPVASASYLSFKYAFEVPFSDSWYVMPPLLQKYSAGELSLSDLWGQHVEQRPFFPRLALLPLAQATRWSFRVGIGFNLVLVGLMVLVFWRMLVLTIREEERPWVPWLVAAFGWLAFSVAQWENLIWDLAGALFFMGVLGAFASFYFLARWPNRWAGTLAAALCALVSMYSLSIGVLLWAVGLVVLLLQGRPKLGMTAFWAAFGAAAVASFFWKWRLRQDLLYIFEDPVGYFRFLFTFLAAPVSYGWGHMPAVVQALGLAGVTAFSLLTVWACFKSGLVFRRALPWLAVGWFVVANAAVGGLFRASFGLRQAFASRYITITSLFWGALVVLTFFFLSHYASSLRSKKKPLWPLYGLGASLAVLLFIGYADGYDYGLDLMREVSSRANGQEMCVLSGCFSKECGSTLVVEAKDFTEAVEILRGLAVGPFRHNLALEGLELLPEPAGRPAGEIQDASWKRLGPAREAVLQLRGWAMDPADKVPASRVALFSNGRELAQVPTAGSLGASAGRDSGPEAYHWSACLASSRLVEGESVIEAYALVDGGKTAVKLKGEPVVSLPKRKSKRRPAASTHP